MNVEWSDGVCPVCESYALVVRRPVIIETIHCQTCGLRTHRPEWYKSYDYEWVPMADLPEHSGKYLAIDTSDAIHVVSFNAFDNRFYDFKKLTAIPNLVGWTELPGECK